MAFNLKFIAMTLSFCGLYQQIKKIKRKMLGCVIKVKRKANLRKRAAFKSVFSNAKSQSLFFFCFNAKRALNLDRHIKILSSSLIQISYSGGVLISEYINVTSAGVY